MLNRSRTKKVIEYTHKIICSFQRNRGVARIGLNHNLLFAFSPSKGCSLSKTKYLSSPPSAHPYNTEISQICNLNY